MMNSIKMKLFTVCAKTGKITGLKKVKGWWKLLFPIIGLAALIWYLVRVIPKPTRAMYPCMQVAAPLAGSFIGFILSLGVLGWAIQKFRKSLWKHRYVVAASCLVLGLGALVFNMNFSIFNSWAATPMGSPKGLFASQGKSRVAWSRDGSAVTAPVSAANWWANQYNDQTKINALVTATVESVGNASDEATAWANIFKDFNSTHGRGGNGYNSSESITVKVNMNNTSTNLGAKGGRTDNNQIDESPQMVIALVTSLKKAGVPENKITITDPSRFMPYHMQQIIRGAGLTSVVLESRDNWGDTDLRVPTFTGDGGIIYSSGTRTGANTHLANSFVQATYVINLAILKGHSSMMTLCGKNFFGSTGIDPDWGKQSSTAHNNFSNAPYAFVDYMANQNLGGKTLLWMIDTLYGSKEANDFATNADGSWHGVDDKWTMYGNQWPGIVLASQDGVAVDSVAIDFFAANFPGENPIGNGWDRYLHDAAVPTNSNYLGPDGTGRLTTSLGIHEHWNNSTDKQYAGNQGSTGIELVYVSSALDPSATPAATPIGTLGDVNGDNSVNIVDALLIAQFYVGLNPSNFNSSEADVNCSGGIDIVDALLVAQLYVGLITAFPC